MPVYNAAPFLEACLNSIILQDYKHLELIAVNDFSEDRSLEILAKYASIDPRIRLIQNTKKGIIPALNLAYSLSTGALITRMDADDLMPLGKISTLASLLLEKGKAYVSTGHVKYFSEEGIASGYKNYELWLNSLCKKDRHFKEIYKECVIPSPCWMMFREDFEAIGAFRSELYPEDYDLCFRMYENTIKVASSEKVCHLWRDHSGRASRNDRNYSDNRFIQLKISKFLQIDYNRAKTLVLWGAGKKGKLIAKELLEAGTGFNWICDNQRKIGKEIYNQTILDADKAYFETKQIIVAVANKREQRAIKEILKLQEAYYFC